MSWLIVAQKRIFKIFYYSESSLITYFEIINTSGFFYYYLFLIVPDTLYQLEKRNSFYSQRYRIIITCTYRWREMVLAIIFMFQVDPYTIHLPIVLFYIKYLKLMLMSSALFKEHTYYIYYNFRVTRVKYIVHKSRIRTFFTNYM